MSFDLLIMLFFVKKLTFLPIQSCRIDLLIWKKMALTLNIEL